MNQNSSRPVFGEQHGSVDTPAWVKDAVFYQIFPDRFATSDTLQKPGGLEPWDTEPTTYGYKGGDLIGIVEHLDYIQDLGATAIYLNPIFQSASNHRYHTHDYFKIDPLLGGDAAFETFMDACKQRGLRVILDGVFNHASRGFFQFNDVLENGAASPWLDWFDIHSHPANAYDHSKPAGYTAWWGLHALPKLNTDNPQVREYIMQVGEYWLKKGIDGWRLDVPDEIKTPGFWEEFRQRMRAINPDCYIVGEIWEVSTEFLSGQRFDALMNYVFTESALAFAGQNNIDKALQDDRAYNPWPGIDAKTYADKIDALLQVYDWNVTTAQFNLLDSHDTSRALTLFGGDVRSLQLAYLLLLTYPGAPSIYYGSEIGLDGGLPDRWARKSMPWDRPEDWNRDLYTTVQALITLRRQARALRTGTYQAVAVGEFAYAFTRKDGEDAFLIAVNAGEQAESLTVPSGVASLILTVGNAAELDAIDDECRVTLPGRSGAIWSVDRG